MSLSPLGFAIAFSKDIVYHLWQFGIRQMETFIVFSIKKSHPEGLIRFPVLWKYICTFAGYAQMLSMIPRYLAICHHIRVSVEDRISDGGGKTT
jgi:hypothetical protein